VDSRKARAAKATAPKAPDFGSFEGEGPRWITALTSGYYPDYLAEAKTLYEGPLSRFGQLVTASADSERLFRAICDESQPGRIQLCRIFRKYVCPETSVELLKQKNRVNFICQEYGPRFRPIAEVRAKWAERPPNDETLAALLWEYKDRGKKGYELTGAFFEKFRANFGKEYEIDGPEGAGRDIQLNEIFKGYPQERPIDFLISRRKGGKVLVVGLARYDSDRGGAQEDDRTGGYKTAIDEILGFSDANKLGLKVMLLNDGPGLLLGSMWRDYAGLERRRPGQVLVATLKMFDSRLTTGWLES
jgi:hypothetical protein